MPNGVRRIPEGQRVVIDVKRGERGCEPLGVRRPKKGSKRQVGRKQKQQGRIEPDGATCVKAGDLDDAASVFRCQQGGDEETGQHEEHIQPHEPTLGSRYPAMKQDDGEHRNGSNTVERRVVLHGWRRPRPQVESAELSRARAALRVLGIYKAPSALVAEGDTLSGEPLIHKRHSRIRPSSKAKDEKSHRSRTGIRGHHGCPTDAWPGARPGSPCTLR